MIIKKFLFNDKIATWMSNADDDNRGGFTEWFNYFNCENLNISFSTTNNGKKGDDYKSSTRMSYEGNLEQCKNLLKSFINFYINNHEDVNSCLGERNDIHINCMVFSREGNLSTINYFGPHHKVDESIMKLELLFNK